MANDKHNFRFCPNVGTVLLILAGMATISSQAAYTVVDHVDTPTVSPRITQPSPATTMTAPTTAKIKTTWRKRWKVRRPYRKNHGATPAPQISCLQPQRSTAPSPAPQDDAPILHNRVQQAASLQPGTIDAPTLNKDVPAQPSRPPREVVYTTPVQIPTPLEAHIWKLQEGRTLKYIVEEWASKAGWMPPVWVARDPYYIETNFLFQGTFIDVLTQVNALVPNLDFQLSLVNKTILVYDHDVVNSRK